MSKEFTNQTLTEIMSRVEKKVEEGFAGVHKRQDDANHSIKKNKQWIDENKECVKTLAAERDNKLKKYTDLTWKIVLAVIMISFGAEKFINFIK